MTVKHQEEQIGKFAREVVLKRSAIVVVVAFVLNFAVARGWVIPDVSHHVQEWVNRGFDYATFIAGAFAIRGAVTPADPKLNPTGADGSALVEAHSAAPTTVVYVHNAPPADEAPAESEADAEPVADLDPALADAVAVEADAEPVAAPAPEAPAAQ